MTFDWDRGLARLAVRRPFATLLFWALVIIAGAWGSLNLHVEATTQSVLDRTSPEWDFYQQSKALFGDDEIIVVALLENGQPLSERLERVKILTSEIEKIPGVRRVDSASTVPVIEVEGDGTVRLDPALRESSRGAASAPVIERLRRDRIAPEILLGADGTTFGINILLDRNIESQFPRIVGAITRLTGTEDVWISGLPVFRVATDSRTREEVMIFVPLVVVVMAALLMLSFGDWRAAVGALLTSAAASSAVMGLLGTISGVLTITTAILPPILFALGTAYSIHLIHASEGYSTEDQLMAAVGETARPVLLSGLTTGAGFLAVGAVEIGAIQAVGRYGGIGAVICAFAALTIVPATARLLPMKGGRGWRAETTPEQLVGFVSANLRPILLGTALASLLCVVGISRLHASTDVTKWFPPGSYVRDSWDGIRDSLSGLTALNVVIWNEDGGSVVSSESIRAIDSLGEAIGRRDDVSRVVSIADPLRQIHGGFLNDSARPLPASDDLISQYLLVLESVEQIDDLLSSDHSAANVVVRMEDNSSSGIRGLAAQVDRWWAEKGVEGTSAKLTGVMYEFARAEDAIVYGQLRGIVYAVGGIGAILLLGLRNVRLVGISLLSNVTPIGLGISAMGLLGVALDAGTVLVASLAMGIAVDDTVHIAHRFQERVGQGAEATEALAKSFRVALRPVVITTLAVTLGFAVLGMSPFAFTRNLGVFTAAVMLACLVANLLLLPALLLAGGRRGLEKVL